MIGAEIEDVVELLSRETPYTRSSIAFAAMTLRVMGWTQHEIRKGVLLVARSGGVLTLSSLLVGAELAGSPERFLEAATGAGG